MGTTRTSRVFVILFVIALAFCSPVEAQDSTSKCPSNCLATKKLAKKECKTLESFGCVVESCKDGAGTNGFACVEPTPPPTKCPSVCNIEKKSVKKECKKLSFLGCTVQKCITDDGSKGWKCENPTPPPSQCPAVCNTDKKSTKKECKKLTSLGCILQKCITEDDSKGWTCALPTPTPTGCPAICSTDKKSTKKTCNKLTSLGCILQKCITEDDSKGWTCALPTPTPTGCPALCSTDKKSTKKACKKLAFLGCKFEKCETSDGEKGWICVGEEPKSCPATCRSNKEEVDNECEGFEGTQCRVRTCSLGTTPTYSCDVPLERQSCIRSSCDFYEEDALKHCNYDTSGFFGCEIQRCALSAGQGYKCEFITYGDGDTINLERPSVDHLFQFYSLIKNPPTLLEDIYFLTDATSSMASEIDTAKEKFRAVISERLGAKDTPFGSSFWETLPEGLPPVSRHFGIGIFRDEEELDNGFENVHSMSDDTASVLTSINSIEATGGSGGAEANLVALYKVATDESIGWREDSRKLLVYFGDFPGHEPSCVGGLEITRNTVIDAINAKGIHIIAVNFGSDVTPETDGSTGFNSPAESFGCGSLEMSDARQGNEIAFNTKGETVSKTDQLDLQNSIHRFMSSSVNGIRYRTDCEPYLRTTTHEASWFPPSKLEENVYSGFVVTSNICDLPTASLECKYEYTIDFEGTARSQLGAVITVKVNNVQGC
ncbi:von Willebrand factor A-like protein [Gracilaria domingensis]|nr:von Willebrand factor A-like protein [Gracilaria domingensis]